MRLAEPPAAQDPHVPGASRQGPDGSEGPAGSPYVLGSFRLDPGEGVERAGFVLLVTLLVSPVVAQGLWRPLTHALGPSGGAVAITWSALATGVVTCLVARIRVGKGRLRPLLGGALVAACSTALLSLGVAGLVTLLAVAAAIAWVVPWVSARLPIDLDGLVIRHKALTLFYLVGALAAVVSVGRLSVFIGDPSRVEMQAVPGEKFLERHSCLSAYAHACSLALQRVDNLYDDRWWHGSHGLPPLPEGVEPISHPFSLDNFSYPPPFLLVASPLALFEGDYLAQRALWFGLNGAFLALGLWVVARWIDGPRAHRALLLAPLFFGSIPALVVLQVGNFHMATVVLSVIAMVALDRSRVVTGGALLALATLSKISPGILGVVLLARRRFRAVAITAGFGALLLVVAALAFGLGPIEGFVRYAMPRLSSGRAFPFMETDIGIATNMGPFGVPFKLRLLGLAVGDPWVVARWVGRAYTIGLLSLAVVGAKRGGDRREQAVKWMALMSLAAFQSPFAPGYATMALLWATTLLSVEVRRARWGLGLVAVWLLIIIAPPGLSLAEKAVHSMAQMVAFVGICAWLVLRAPRRTQGQVPDGVA